MRACLFLLCSFIFSAGLAAQDVVALTKEGDKMEAVPDENAAFSLFKEVLKIQPVNVYALNKCSELCSRIGKRQHDKKAMDNYYTAAKTYAGIALRVAPENAESNCVMAIALGRSSLNKSGKEKIASAREIKKYVDLAIKYDPYNFKAWHVLGRWNYELSGLNMVERTAAKILYGSVPEGSITNAIYAFQKSNSITDGFILNYLELAKAYKRNDEKNKAIASLNKMMQIPNHTEDDPGIKEEGRRLLNDLQ